MKRLVGIAAATIGMLLTALGPTQAASLTDPMAFGAFPQPASKAATLAYEANAGRSMAFIRVYDRWDSTFPETNTTWMKSTGHSLFLSIKTRLKNGTNLSWAAIGAAKPGDPLYLDMQRWASEIKGYGSTIYVSFNHEPDNSNSRPSGGPADYIAAYRNFISVMRAEGVTNAIWAWTGASRNFATGTTRYAPDYYPGDDVVDAIAVDAYNMYCQTKTGKWANPWRSLGQILAPFMTFAGQHPGKPLVVAEFGSPENPADATAKANWITDAENLFKQPGYERFVAVSYWNSNSVGYANCSFKITTSTAALSAYQAMGADPFYSGTVH
jgi:beta-mannanase